MAKSWDEIKKERWYYARNEKLNMIKKALNSEKTDKNNNTEEPNKDNSINYIYNTTINNINLDIKNIEIGDEAYRNLVEALKKEIKGI